MTAPAPRPNPLAGRSLGFLLLCFFLIVYGILRITNIHFAFDSVVEGLLAALAGLLLLLGY